jgi:hypothetical protein
VTKVRAIEYKRKTVSRNLIKQPIIFFSILWTTFSIRKLAVMNRGEQGEKQGTENGQSIHPTRCRRQRNLFELA